MKENFAVDAKSKRATAGCVDSTERFNWATEARDLLRRREELPAETTR